MRPALIAATLAAAVLPLFLLAPHDAAFGAGAPTSGAKADSTRNKGASADHGDCGWAGVRVGPMTAAVADSLGMAEPYGAIFAKPRPGGPAAMAGIQAGDVVTAINGIPVRRASDFAKIVSANAPNTRVALTTWRSRQLIEVRVVLGAGRCLVQR